MSTNTKEEVFSIDVHHVVPPDLKTTYATGAIIGAMPSGNLHVAFYLDRPPIADLVTFQITDGQPLKELNKSIRNGITRDFQNAVVLDMQTATALSSALQMVLDAMKQQRTVASPDQSNKINNGINS